LVEPITKEQYQKKQRRTPPSLFAHNTQVKVTQSVHAQDTVAKGVLGRLVDELASQPQPYRTGAYSVSGIAKILEGERSQTVLDQRSGVVRFKNRVALQSALTNMTRMASKSVFAETYSALLEDSLSSSESIGAVLDATTLTETFASDTIAQQLEQTARVIKARDQLQEERQVFFVSLGGFDTHASELDTVQTKFTQINSALTTFIDEMKAQGAWDKVTLLTASDFGRTLGSNGAGTDHAWGGHYMALGGSVNGGKMLGTYPDKLDETSDVNIGRNHRILPTTAWEMVWFGLSEWFGASVSRIAEKILPNARNFPTASRITAAQLIRAR